jgi:GNAT superfamily N-acetyltransferase
VSSTNIVPFNADHIDDAAALLAARHQAGRRREPLLPRRFEDPGECRPLIESLLPKGSGVAALRDGRLAGYLLTENEAVHEPQRRALIPSEGHALAGNDGIETYREMYAALAPELIRLGIFAHQVIVPSAGEAAGEAWFSLTFGQRMHIAGRVLEPVDARTSEVDIRLAGQDDIDTVWRLFTGLGYYNTTSPLFVPDIWDDDVWRRDLEANFSQPSRACFLAYQAAEPVAAMYLGTPRDLMIDCPPARAHVWIAYTRKAARRSGAGAALLQRCDEWAGENGYQYLTLEYFTANLLGARFWENHGFRPLATILERRLDPRIAWADGTNP